MRLLLLSLALCLPLAACGGKMLDTGKVEDEVKRSLGPRYGVSIRSVDCPGDRDAKAGDRFDCDAVLSDGTRAVIEVTQRDDAGHYEALFKPGTLPVNTAQLEAELRRRLARQGIQLKGVACAEGTMVRKGATVRCRVTDSDGDRTTLAVTFTDDRGAFSFAPVK